MTEKTAIRPGDCALLDGDTVIDVIEVAGGGVKYRRLSGSLGIAERNRVTPLRVAEVRRSVSKAREATGKLDGFGDPIDDDGRYFVADARQYVGNCMLWWCPNGAGYTCNLEEAGTYKGDRCRSMRTTDVPWPVDFIRANVVVHVRGDMLPRREVAQ